MIGNEFHPVIETPGPADSNLRIAGLGNPGRRKILHVLGKARAAG
jgi:hypothetical protein